MRLETTDQILAIVQLPADLPLPPWVHDTPFVSITRTKEELSIVCLDSVVPDDVTAAREWRAIKVEGPLDFGLSGVISALAVPLAEAEIPIFAISTFECDYILVRAAIYETACSVLRRAGHSVT